MPTLADWHLFEHTPILFDPRVAGSNAGTIWWSKPYGAVLDTEGGMQFLGAVAGGYLFALPGVDGTLAEQARAIAGQQLAAPVSQADWFQGRGMETFPWNWALVSIQEGASTYWLPLAASGAFDVPVAGQSAAYYGVGPNDPVFLVSAGYEITGISPVHPVAQTYGFLIAGTPVVTVSYRRTGSVPAPNQGRADGGNPRLMIPDYQGMLAEIHASIGQAAPSYTYPTGPRTADVLYPQEEGMTRVLVGQGATVAGSLTGPAMLQATAPAGGGVAMPVSTGFFPSLAPVRGAAGQIGAAASGLLANPLILGAVVIGAVWAMSSRRR